MRERSGERRNERQQGQARNARRKLGKEGHKVVITLSGVTAVVGSLGEDEQFTDERLREWAWRRKQLTLQQLMEHFGLLVPIKGHATGASLVPALLSLIGGSAPPPCPPHPP